MLILLSAINRIAFTIGDVQVAWYGIIIVSAMLLGLVYLMWQCTAIGLNRDDAVEFFLWVIPLAVIFARILYVVVRPDEYFPWNSWDDFVNAIAIWDGGITIIGGILGGMIGAGIFSYRMRKKANFGQILDLIIVPVLLGQVIGRIGNFINQEAFGKPSYLLGIPEKFPFSIYIDNPSGVSAEYRDLVYDNVPGWFAATFFYEMVWNFIGAVICFVVWKKNKKFPGILGIFYFFWYFLGRGLLEFVRIDSVPVTQVACFVMAPVALIFGVLYVLSRENQLDFRKVNNAFESGTLASTELTSLEIKNYRFAAKWLMKNGKFAKKFYGVDEITVADTSDGNYIKKVKKPKQKAEETENLAGNQIENKTDNLAENKTDNQVENKTENLADNPIDNQTENPTDSQVDSQADNQEENKD